MFQERENSMANWISKTKDISLSQKFSQNLTKLQRLEILKSLNLPLEEYIYIAHENSQEKIKEIVEFVDKKEKLLLIAIPKKECIPRKFKESESSFSNVKHFISEINKNLKGEEWDLLIKNHEAPKKSGTIISNRNKLIIEISNKSLSDHLEGKGIPETYILNKNNQEEISNVRLESKHYFKEIKDILANIKEIEGYFEFIIGTDNKLKFWEYKNDAKYLNV